MDCHKLRIKNGASYCDVHCATFTDHKYSTMWVNSGRTCGYFISTGDYIGTNEAEMNKVIPMLKWTGAYHFKNLVTYIKCECDNLMHVNITSGSMPLIDILTGHCGVIVKLIHRNFKFPVAPRQFTDITIIF